MRNLAAAILAFSAPMVLAAGGYELVWEDEFDQLFVDPGNWEFMIGNGAEYGNPGWGNNELEYYTSRPVNVGTQNGALYITAQRENYQGFQYTSTRMRTQGRFSFTYGRVEARIKLPVGEGLWPAFWMMPEDSVYGGWAASGEIDIMEPSTDASRVYGTLHYGGLWPNNQSTGGIITGSFGNEWHVFALEWEPDVMRWYVDDQLFSLKTSSSWFTTGAPGDENAPFDQRFHMLLNMAVGGNFVQDPTPSSPFPKTMEVDWVRVYQLSQAPFAGIPTPVPGVIEAEDFDLGYDGQAYHDTTASNEGGQYRTDTGVDIEACSEGGYNIGWVREGEWIEYTIDAQQAGTYRIDARTASASAGGTFRLLFDGQDVGANFTAPGTGGWQTWTTGSAEVDLPAGETVMRFENLGTSSQDFNINRYTFTFLAPDCLADLAEPFGVLDLADINAFTSGFLAGDPAADLAAPYGVLDLADINAFVASFLSGCP
ncbi:MAG: family 16 glycosylhydrolase [Phycisphaeraceae bacterium]|nr:MAG: family 16 glycosylhydrolase [Phycisphaeraceae bacterium]